MAHKSRWWIRPVSWLSEFPKKAPKLFATAIWAATADLWIFFSGVVAGLGANVFATRALADPPQTSLGYAWLEFVVFLAASGFGVLAGLFRRRAEENWRGGGARPGYQQNFLSPQLPWLTASAVLAFSLVILGLLMITWC